MSEKKRKSAEVTSEAEQATEAPQKRPRTVRPLYLLVPREGGGFDVYTCFGFGEVRKALEESGIDVTDPRHEGLILLRGEKVPLHIQQQTVIRFGNR